MSEYMTPAMVTTLTGAGMGLAVAGALFFKDWLTNRTLRTTLENLKLQAQIAAESAALVAKELEASKEVDKVQAKKIEKIEELSVTTHAIVNSQRSEMKAEMERQKTDLEKVIAQLRNDLLLAQSVGRAAPQNPTPPLPAPGDPAAPMPPGVAPGEAKMVVIVPELVLPVTEPPEKPRIIQP